MQDCCEHLLEGSPFASAQNHICVQPDLTTSGIWASSVFLANAGHGLIMKILLPHYLDDVSKPAAEEYRVKIQESFDHQVWSPSIPILFTPVSGISKTTDGGAFNSRWRSSQVILCNDLIHCATAAHVMPAMVAIEMGSPINSALCTVVV